MLGDSSLRRIARPEEVKAVGSFLRANSRSLEDSFRTFDSKSLGHLTLDSFQGGLGRMGYDGPNAEGVFRAIDSTHTGLISLHSFLVAFAGNKEDGRSSWGSTSRGHTPRLDRSIESQLSWPESLEGAPTEVPNLALPPAPPSSDSLKGVGQRSLPDLAQQVDKLRSELQVERTERQVEFTVLRERLTSPSGGDWQDSRGLPELIDQIEALRNQVQEARSHQQVELAMFRGTLEAQVVDLKTKMREVQEEAEDFSKRMRMVEGAQDPSTFLTQASTEARIEARSVVNVEIESWRAEAQSSKAELQNHRERIAALEGSLRAEVEDLRRKVTSVESQQDLNSQPPPTALEALKTVSVESEAWRRQSQSTEASVQNHQERIAALEGSLQAEVQRQKDRFAALERSLKDEAKSVVSSEIESLRTLLNNSDGELDAHKRRLVAMESSMSVEVEELRRMLLSLESQQIQNSQPPSTALEALKTVNVESEAWRRQSQSTEAAVRNHQERLAALEGSLQAEVQRQKERMAALDEALKEQAQRIVTAEVESLRTLLNNSEGELDAHQRRLVALESSTSVEVEELRKKLLSLESQQLQNSKPPPTALEALKTVNVESEAWRRHSQSTEAAVRNHQERIAALEGSLQAEAQRQKERMASLEEALKDQPQHAAATSAQIEAWKDALQSTEAHLTQKIVTLERSLPAEVDDVCKRVDELEMRFRTQPIVEDVVQSLRVELVQQIEALQTSVPPLRTEVDEARKKLRELDAHIRMMPSRQEDIVAPSAVRDLAQQFAGLERALRTEVTDVRKSVEQLEAVSGAKADAEAELQNHKQRIVALEASVQAEAEGSLKRMQVLENRQEQFKMSFLTQATNEAHLEASNAIRSELEAWKAQLKGFDAELQVQEQRLATLESSSQVEVKSAPPSSNNHALALPSTVVPGLGLEAVAKELQDLRHKFEEAVQIEARTRADEDRRIERAYSQDIKAGLGALAREINAHATHLDEVQKSIGAEREERTSKHQALSNMVQESLQAMIAKIDNSCKGLAKGLPQSIQSIAADTSISPSIDIIGTASEASSQDSPRAKTDERGQFVSQIDALGSRPRRTSRPTSRALSASANFRAASPFQQEAIPVLRPSRMSPTSLPSQPVTADKSAQVLQMIESLREEVVQLRRADLQVAARRLTTSSSRCGSQDARPPLSGGLASPTVRAVSLDRSSPVREAGNLRALTMSTAAPGSPWARTSRR